MEGDAVFGGRQLHVNVADGADDELDARGTDLDLVFRTENDVGSGERVDGRQVILADGDHFEFAGIIIDFDVMSARVTVIDNDQVVRRASDGGDHLFEFAHDGITIRLEDNDRRPGDARNVFAKLNI